jgi:hypothetical protein
MADDADMIRLARSFDELDSPGAEPLTGDEDMEQIEQKTVSLRERMKAFDQRMDARIDHAVNVAAAKAKAAKRRIAREIMAVITAEDDPEDDK